MIEWTESARRLLNDYCVRSKAVLAGGSVDADEVSDDLRRHVEEEVRAAKLSIVTEEDIRRILARVGEPETSPKAVQGGIPPDREKVKPSTKRPGFVLLFFGVILPAFTWLFEILFGGSAGALFDPFPTWLHVIAVAMVPIVNGWMWHLARTGDAGRQKLLGWLNGAVLGICIYYAILYLAFVPYAAIGIIFFGLGLLPLSPYFALIATPLLRAKYSEGAGLKPLPGAWVGSLGAILMLLLVQFPTAATYYGLAKSVAEEPETKAHGIRVLRTFGDREMMLRACYGSLRRELELDLIRSISAGDQRVSAEQAREAYYRVTGKPFNSVPPPALYTRMGRWAALDNEFTWDEGLGGEAVAQRVKGLSLLSSRMDAVAEPDASLVYCEWIMEFKNVSTQQREARAQVALPPGAVVSRVTLWIDGEEREAAFGGRGQVRAAYQEVAVVQRRDPILVTTCGPDRVLMQCFPVPAEGGVMKIKLGITAPLILDSAEKGQFVWPKFLERNFAVSSDLKHDLWIESSRALANGKSESAKPISPDRPFALRGALKEIELVGAVKTVTVHRNPEVLQVFTPASEQGAFIQQTLQKVVSNSVRRLAIVVDGSDGMKPYAAQIADALSELGAGVEVALFVADDRGSKPEQKFEPSTPENLKQWGTALSRMKFGGGQDNLPALEAAWDAASSVEDGVVLWIHGPEAVLLSAESGLRQRLERNLMRTRVLELQTETGPDRVLEKLDGLAALKHVPRLGSPGEDLKRLFGKWKGAVPSLDLVRQRVTDAKAGISGSRHIERLWARDEAAKLAAEHKVEEATLLAAKNQLVTPLTGAVVLERKEQYDRHGLTPADATTVPSVPEPSVLSLLGVGIFAYAMAKRRRRRNA